MTIVTGLSDPATSPFNFSHSSPVHRSQSFHTTNIADLETLDYSSEETEDDLVITLPVDPMITSTHSDILDLRPKDYRENLRRQAMTNDVVLARDYVANFQVRISGHIRDIVSRHFKNIDCTYVLMEISVYILTYLHTYRFLFRRRLGKGICNNIIG